jgi:hypothetical protein
MLNPGTNQEILSMNTEQFVGRQEFVDYDADGHILPYETDEEDDVMMTDDWTPDSLRADVIEEMRWWLADCTLPDGYDAPSLDAYEIIRMVSNGYDGGIEQFLADGAGE